MIGASPLALMIHMVPFQMSLWILGLGAFRAAAVHVLFVHCCVDSLRKGAKPVADQVTAVVDKALERAEAEAEEKKGGSGRGSGRVARTHTVTSRERGLTLSEQRAVERKVEVRGGLAAVMSNR